MPEPRHTGMGEIQGLAFPPSYSEASCVSEDVGISCPPPSRPGASRTLALSKLQMSPSGSNALLPPTWMCHKKKSTDSQGHDSSPGNACRSPPRKRPGEHRQPCETGGIVPVC
jgi:hypothetical protein